MADRLDEFKGRVKEAAGKATNNERLEIEGKTEAEGSSGKRKAKGAVRQVGGAIKEGVGKLTGDRAAQAEGKADQIRGRTQQKG